MDQPKFPEEIQFRITNEFLSTFKEKLEEILFREKPNKPTYWNYYKLFANSNGFNKALYSACQQHNLKDLYTYRNSLDIYDSEILGNDFTEMLFERGIIEEGTYAIYWKFERNIFQKIKWLIILWIYNLKH